MRYKVDLYQDLAVEAQDPFDNDPVSEETPLKMTELMMRQTSNQEQASQETDLGQGMKIGLNPVKQNLMKKQLPPHPSRNRLQLQNSASQSQTLTMKIRRTIIL